MLLFEYKPNTVYKVLKHFSWRHAQEDVLWQTDQEILEEHYERILINEWNLVNNFYYYCTEISKTHVLNISKYYGLFKGVIFDEKAYLSEHFKILHQFCVENDLEIIINKGVPTYEICGICRKDT